MQHAHSHPTRADLSLSAVRGRFDPKTHYISRVPLRIAALQKSSNVQDVAKSLSDDINDVATTTVTTDGSLSFRLRDSWLFQHITHFAQRQGRPFIAQSGGESGIPQRVLVDYCSPNMAKELHVGHVRSAIIGHAIANTLECLGHDVQRVSHVGDFGTPIARVVARALELKLPWALLHPGAEQPSVGDLATLYKEAVAQESSPEFDTLTQRIVAAIQSSAAGAPADAQLVGAWRAVCASSRSSFARIFERLGINPVERGESFYAPMLPGVISELERHQLVRSDGGGLVADVAGAPLIVRKRDGSYLYGTTDLAAVRHRVEQLGRQWVIYVVDISQKLHFEQVFQLARAAKFYDPEETRLSHAAFGMMLGSDGRKFSSRRGSGAPLEFLLDEARARAKVARGTVRTPGSSMTQAEEEVTDEHLGMASIRFFDLLHERTKNYQFDLDRMLDVKASSAVYVTYCYARALSLLRNAGVSFEGAFADVERAHDELVQRDNVSDIERALLVKLAQFDDVVLDVERTLLPHLLCDYACGVAETFNSFYSASRVLDAPEKLSRLLLCWATAHTLRNAMRLIGIEPLERL